MLDGAARCPSPVPTPSPPLLSPFHWGGSDPFSWLLLLLLLLRRYEHALENGRWVVAVALPEVPQEHAGQGTPESDSSGGGGVGGEGGGQRRRRVHRHESKREAEKKVALQACQDIEAMGLLAHYRTKFGYMQASLGSKKRPCTSSSPSSSSVASSMPRSGHASPKPVIPPGSSVVDCVCKNCRAGPLLLLLGNNLAAAFFGFSQPYAIPV
jgi:hypothetical protein